MLLAISHVSKELAKDWDNANQLSWCYHNPTPTSDLKDDKSHQKTSGDKGTISSNYRGKTPWPTCDKCQLPHNPAHDCPKKSNNSGGGGGGNNSNTKKRPSFGGSPSKNGKAPWVHKSGGDKRSKTGNQTDKLSISNYTQNVIHKSIKLTQAVDLVNTIINPRS